MDAKPARRSAADPVDLDAAMLDPTTVFDDPEDVLASAVLTDDQKATVLERWGVEADRIAASAEVHPDDAAEARDHAAGARLALSRLQGSPPAPA